MANNTNGGGQYTPLIPQRISSYQGGGGGGGGRRGRGRSPIRYHHQTRRQSDNSRSRSRSRSRGRRNGIGNIATNPPRAPDPYNQRYPRNDSRRQGHVHGQRHPPRHTNGGGGGGNRRNRRYVRQNRMNHQSPERGAFHGTGSRIPNDEIWDEIQVYPFDLIGLPPDTIENIRLGAYGQSTDDRVATAILRLSHRSNSIVNGLMRAHRLPRFSYAQLLSIAQAQSQQPPQPSVPPSITNNSNNNSNHASTSTATGNNANNSNSDAILESGTSNANGWSFH